MKPTKLYPTRDNQKVSKLFHFMSLRNLSQCMPLPVSMPAIVWMVVAAGCVAPKNKIETSQIPPASEQTTPADAEKEKIEEEKPQKQETLAAVEDFLARTQDYRRPVALETKAQPGTTAPHPAAHSSAPTETSKMIMESPPGPEIAVANSQVVIGEKNAAPTQPIPAVESISIKAAPAKSPAKSTKSSGRTANAMIETQEVRTQQAAESLLSEFKAELQDRKDAASEWKLRMLLLTLGRTSEAASVGENTPPEMAGVMPALCSAADAIRGAIRNPVDGTENALEQVEALREKIAAGMGPTVSNVALCRKVTTFGSYEEMAADDFVAGRSVQTIVYAEIDNLRASPAGSGAFETRISTRIEIWSADGKSMWQREEPEVVDRCRRARRDFFVAQKITLPPTLPEGEYVLRVTVEDKGTRLIGDGSVHVRLASPISMAKGE